MTYFNGFDSVHKLVESRKDKQRWKVPWPHRGAILLILVQIGTAVLVDGPEELQDLQACLHLQKTLGHVSSQNLLWDYIQAGLVLDHRDKLALRLSNDTFNSLNSAIKKKRISSHIPLTAVTDYRSEGREPPPAAHLMYEEVAGVLQQNNDACWTVVISGIGPNQAHHVHQRPDLSLHVGELHVLQVLKERLQRL